MTQELKEQLFQIYNALMSISTKGEDSIIMVQCLQALSYLINNYSNDIEAIKEEK